MTSKTKIFYTRDLYLAAALSTLGFALLNIDYQIEGDKKVGYMNFEETNLLKKAEIEYWQGKLVVEPRTYATHLNGLKAQIVNKTKGPRTEFEK